MSVKQDASGRRFVQLEIELPGTPDEVWQAIATAQGLSSWFVPATFDVQDGAPVAVTLDFGGGMLSRSIVKEWNPPHTFVREGQGWAPGSPPLATEFYVEAKSGGVSVFRVVQSLFASTDDWDGQLTGAEEGWPEIFRILRLYFTHFRGQPSSTTKVMAPVHGTAASGWSALTGALGLTQVGVGDRWHAPADAPALGGVVEHVNDAPFGIMLRTDEPGPGIVSFGTIEFGATVLAGVTFFFYGDDAAQRAAREQTAWQSWLTACLGGA